MSRLRFTLVHRETGLTLGEFRMRFPLRYWSLGSGMSVEDDNFRFEVIRPIIRSDGAIGFQRLNPTWDEGQLYFLHREDWEVKFRETGDAESNRQDRKEMGGLVPGS